MSMTNEEAIERLERLKRSCRDLAAGMPDEPGWTLHGMALDMALTALRPVSREQVEKVWRGEWELVRRMAASIECKCSKCQRTAVFAGRHANFCEKCGSAMTDEAVEMVMERLEALHEIPPTT